MPGVAKLSRANASFTSCLNSRTPGHSSGRRLLVAAEQTRRERWVPATQKANRPLTYLYFPFRQMTPLGSGKDSLHSGAKLVFSA